MIILPSIQNSEVQRKKKKKLRLFLFNSENILIVKKYMFFIKEIIMGEKDNNNNSILAFFPGLSKNDQCATESLFSRPPLQPSWQIDQLDITK